MSPSASRLVLIVILLVPLLLGLTLRLLPFTFAFIDDEVQSRIDGPLLASLTEKIARENPTLAQREQAVLIERAFQRATESADYRSLRDGAVSFYKNALKDDAGWYLPSNEAYQWYGDALSHPFRLGYASVLGAASLLFPLRFVVLFMPVVLALMSIALIFYIASFLTSSLFGRFFAALLVALHPLFLVKTIPGGGDEAFFVLGLLFVVLLIFVSLSARPLKQRFAAGAGALLLAGFLSTTYFFVSVPVSIIPVLTSLSVGEWIHQYSALILLTGIVGIAVLFFSGRRWQGVLCSLWLATGILLSFFINQTNQTTLFIFPIIVLANAAAVGYACEHCALFARTNLHVPAFFGQALTGVLLLLIFVPSLLVVPELRPAYDDEWHAVVREIQSTTPIDARVAAWGNEAFIAAIAERPVVSATPAGTYWLARALNANETEAVAIFHMLACTDTPSLPPSNNSPIPRNPTIPPRDPSCSPPPFLLVVDEKLRQEAPAWTQLGRWDFEKAALWNVYHLGKDVSSLRGSLNYTDDQSRETTKRLGLLVSEPEAQSWIGPPASYIREQAVCDAELRCTLTTQTNALVFRLNGHAVTIENARTKKQPASVVWVDESGFHEHVNVGDTAAFSVGILTSGNETRLALLDPTLTQNIATRLLLYNASSLTSFTPLAHRRSLTGGDITVWNVALQ